MASASNRHYSDPSIVSKPNDANDLALFLRSPAAALIAGQVIVVDEENC
jgi:hypothetical protein